MLFVGLRGVGKTVLLNKVLHIATEQYNYVPIFIEIPTDNKPLSELLIPPIKDLLRRFDRIANLNQKVKSAIGTLKSFANGLKITLPGDITIGMEIDSHPADSGDMEIDLPILFVAVAEAAAAQNSQILILIDEMHYLNETELSALIMGIHKITQKQLPLALIGAGLPQLVGLAGKSKSYSERLLDFHQIGPLNDTDAQKAISEPANREGVTFDASAIHDIIHHTNGYPYFLQEWGYLTWNEAPNSPITRLDVERTTPLVITQLDQSFFRVRFDRLTPKEKQYLRAMAELGPGPHRSGDIAETLGAPVNTVAPVRNSLIKKGMIYSPTHGDTAFTVPLFDQFMKRTMPLA
jgi:hypothetical protein